MVASLLLHKRNLFSVFIYYYYIYITVRRSRDFKIQNARLKIHPLSGRTYMYIRAYTWGGGRQLPTHDDKNTARNAMYIYIYIIRVLYIIMYCVYYVNGTCGLCRAREHNYTF